VVENWSALIAALLLLWLPPSLMLAAKARRRLSHERTASEFGFWRGALQWQNWVDLARGYAGTYLIHHYAMSSDEDVRWEVFGLSAGILVVALMVQTIRRYHGRTYFLAPVFFVWGMAFVLAGPLLAFYGIAAGWLVAVVARNAEWQLPVTAAVVGGVGYLTAGLSPGLLIAVVLIAFPVLVAFCGRGHMVFLMRDQTSPDNKQAGS
jgi:hypothetical protein